MDELYSIIGRLYADIFNAQKYIDMLKNQIKDQDKIIEKLNNDIKEINDRQ
jgi:peptidoglycan hydrolase CwlO-like protein